MADQINKLKKGRHWNAQPIIHKGKPAVEFSAKWVNFLDENGDWKEINCLIEKQSDGFRVTKAPFNFFSPLFADGIAEFETDVRYDIFDQSEITEAPMKQTLHAVQAKKVEGELFDINGDGRLDAVIYKQAFPQWDADLIYYVKHGRAPRLEKLVRFNSAPKKDLDIDFDITYSEDTDIEKNVLVERNGKQEREKEKWDKTKDTKITTKEGVKIQKRGSTQKRGVGMKDFYIWDSNEEFDKTFLPLKKKEKIDVSIERKRSKNYTLTKHIKTAFFTPEVIFPVFTDATDTFYPDPDTESTSVDGWASDEQSTWNSAHDGSGTNSSDSNGKNGLNLYVGRNGSPYLIRRVAILFDTSALPDTATISSATLSTYLDTHSNADNDGDDFVSVITSTPASNTAIANGDYDAIGDAIDDPTEQIDSGERLDLTGLSTGQYYDFDLNSTGIGNISKTGISKFGLREGHDILDNAISLSNDQFNGFLCSGAEYTGTTRDPKLVVTYTTAVNYTATPSTQVITFTIPTYSVKYGVTDSPATLSFTFSIPTPTITAEQFVTVTPSTQVITFTIPAHSVVEGSGYTDTPTTLGITFSIPTYTIDAGGNITLAVSTQAITFSIPTYSQLFDNVIAVSTQSITFSIPTASVATGTGISPSTLAITFSIPTASVVTENTQVVTTQSITFTIPAYTVVGQTAVAVSTQVITFSVPTATIVFGVTLEPDTQVITFSIPTLAKSGGLWRKNASQFATGSWTKQSMTP